MRHQNVYIIACSYCAARTGKPCHELTTFECTGEVVWSPPHKVRKDEAQSLQNARDNEQAHASA